MFVSTLPARPTVTVSLEEDTLLFVTVPVFVFPNRTVKNLKRFTKRGELNKHIQILYTFVDVYLSKKLIGFPNCYI